MLRVSLLMKDLDGAHWEGALCIALHLANADCRYRLAVMSDVTLSFFRLLFALLQGSPLTVTPVTMTLTALAIHKQSINKSHRLK